MEIFKSVELILLLSFGRPAASDTSLPITQVVVVTAKRLTAAEKRDERRVATQGGSGPRS